MNKEHVNKNVGQTIIQDIINQGDTTIAQVQSQQRTSISEVTANTDINLARLETKQTTIKADLEAFKNAKAGEINTSANAKQAEIQNNLDVYEGVKEGELDQHNAAKKIELNELKAELEDELRLLVTEAIKDKGVVPAGADWRLLKDGTYYVADLAGSNYTHHPILEPEENSGICMVADADRGNYKVIRYYSIAKRMHFVIKTATNKWTEWSSVQGVGGVRYEYTQPDHGFSFTPVMLDGITNKWVKATKVYGADGIAVAKSSNSFELILNGSVVVPSATKDIQGNALIADEFYFLSSSVAGGLDRVKPIDVFQPLMRTYLDIRGKMWAEIQIDTPIDLQPRILVDLIEPLGLQLKEDLGLHTESKNLVGAINENKSRIDSVETNYQPKSEPTLTTTAKTIAGAINELDLVIREGKSNDKMAANIIRIGGICYCFGYINISNAYVAPFTTTLTYTNVKLRPRVGIQCPFGNTDDIVGAIGTDGVMSVTVAATGLGVSPTSRYVFSFPFEPVD